MPHDDTHDAARADANASKPGQRRALTIGILIATVILLMLGVGMLLSGTAGSSAREQHFADLGAGLHLASLADPLPKPYNSNPPTSGYHLGSVTAPWGIQRTFYPDALTVHNLEHGGVLLFYRAGSDQATIARLTEIAAKLQRSNPCITLMPRPAEQLDVPIAMTAWTYLLTLDRVDELAITSFFRAHVGRGPESVCQPAS